MNVAFGSRLSAGSPPGRTACSPGKHERAVVDVARRRSSGAGVLVRPVHADRELGERRLVERVEQRVHVADRVDLVLAGLLRPAAAVEPRNDTPPARFSYPHCSRPYAVVLGAMFQSTRST